MSHECIVTLLQLFSFFSFNIIVSVFSHKCCISFVKEQKFASNLISLGVQIHQIKLSPIKINYMRHSELTQFSEIKLALKCEDFPIREIKLP